MTGKKRFDLCFWALLSAVGIITAYLLYKVSLNPVMGENFDITIHNKIAQYFFSGDDYLYARFAHVYKYPLYHICVNLLGGLLSGNYTLAGAVVMAASDCASMAVSRKIILSIVKPKPEDRKQIALIDILCACMLFIMPLAGVLTGGYYYKFVSSPNIWHNPTYIAVRPFGLLSILFFVRMLEDFTSNKSYTKNLLLYSLFCVLSALAKPSFPFFILPAMAVYMLVFVLKNFKARWRFGINVLLSVIPVGAVLMWQSLSIFGEGSIVSTVVNFGGYGNFSFAQVVKATLAVAPVPILYFLCGGYKKLFSSPWAALAFAGLLFGWAEMYFLDIANTLGVQSSGDFSWQYSLSVFFAYVVAVGELIKRVNEKRSLYTYILCSVCAVLFAAQLYFGIKYLFLFITSRGVYFI